MFKQSPSVLKRWFFSPATAHTRNFWAKTWFNFAKASPTSGNWAKMTGKPPCSSSRSLYCNFKYKKIYLRLKHQLLHPLDYLVNIRVNRFQIQQDFQQLQRLGANVGNVQKLRLKKYNYIFRVEQKRLQLVRLYVHVFFSQNEQDFNAFEGLPRHFYVGVREFLEDVEKAADDLLLPLLDQVPAAQSWI